MLIDVTKCIGCRGCQVACKNWNQLPAEKTQFQSSYENPPEFLPYTWTRVTFNEIGEGDNLQWCFAKRQCMHCREAVCVMVCPVEAAHKTKLGTVDIDQGKCTGCGLCQIYCPFDVPKVDQEIKKAFKCRLCLDRIANNLPPACVQACPTGALQFGEEQAMVTVAEARVAALQRNGHPKAMLYGKGYAQVIYVLGDVPANYKIPVYQGPPSVSYLWEWALKPVKSLFAVGSILAVLGNYSGLSAAKTEEEKEGNVA